MVTRTNTLVLRPYRTTTIWRMTVAEVQNTVHCFPTFNGSVWKSNEQIERDRGTLAQRGRMNPSYVCSHLKYPCACIFFFDQRACLCRAYRMSSIVSLAAQMTVNRERTVFPFFPIRHSVFYLVVPFYGQFCVTKLFWNDKLNKVCALSF